DNSDTIRSVDVTLNEGSTYYLIASGNPQLRRGTGSFQMAALEGAQTASGDDGDVSFVVFHGTPDLENVDVRVQGGATLVPGLEFQDFSDYVTVPAADYTLEVAPTGGFTLATVTAPLADAGGGSVLVMASGFFGDTPGFGINVVGADGSVTTLPASEGPAYPYPVDPETPVMDDEFIFFVEGPNVDVEQMRQAIVVDDPDEPGNKVAQFAMGSFTQRGFHWDSEGVNMQAQVERGDTLFMRLRVASDQSRDLELTFRDFFVGNADPNLQDIQFSVNWTVPEAFYDDTWRDIELPLPFPTRAAQDSARVGKNADGTPMANPLSPDDPKLQWSYGDAWIGSPVGPSHPLWKDFTWFKVAIVGMAGQGSGYDWWMDDVYIGGAGTDLSVGTQAPSSPLPTISAVVSPARDSVTVRWTHDPASDISGYRLLYRGEPIDGVTDEIASVVGSYAASAELEYTFPVFSPHPNVADQTYHLALAGSNQYSFIPDDAPLSATSITTRGMDIPFIYALSADQEAAIINNLDSEVASPDGFDTSMMPFELVGEFDPSDPENHPYSGRYHGPDDGSAKIWMAYRYDEGADATTLYLYAEVMDNSPDSDLHDLGIWELGRGQGTGMWVHDFGAPNYDTNLIWNNYLRDQLQLYFGTYDVDFVTGSPNGLRSRGERPDYFLALQPYVSAESFARTGPVDGMMTRLWLEEGLSTDGSVPDSTYYYNSFHDFEFLPAYEDMLDATGERIGYKMLIGISMADLIVDPDEEDAPFTPPGDDEIKFIPLSFNLIDKDDDHIGGRGNSWEQPSTVIPWSTKPDAGLAEGDNSVADVGAVAIIGRNVINRTSSEDVDEIPGRFALEQNYPNPFNPTTSIRFELPATRDVTLTVYNVLGQQVTTLIDGAQLGRGTHRATFDARNLASGLYVYRLQAGSDIATRTMMLVK
ncbi:MAG: DUF4397 domain-containing protein, partial [Bacteroidota bacterium]